MSNIFREYTHPHSMSRVKDESIRENAREFVLPVHRPLFPLRAAKGKVGEIVWVSGAEALEYFGEATFDKFGPYYRNEQTFLELAVFPNQRAFCVRLADPAAAAATMVIEAHVVEGVDVQQYQRDANGAFVYDAQNRPIPLLDSSNNPIKEPGVKIRHVVRPLAENEKFDELEPKTVSAGSETTIIYPLVAAKYNSPGKAGDRAGLRFFFDQFAQDEDLLASSGAVLYSFSVYEKPFDSDIASVLRDKFQNSVVNFVMKPGSVDSRTMRRIASDDIITNNYSRTDIGGTQVSTLPYELFFYPENFKAIGDKVKAVEVNNVGLTDGWMVDVLSLRDLKGHPYHHAVLDTTGVGFSLMSDITTHYLAGGNDGDLTDEKFEEMYRSLLEFDFVPELQNTARYPVTHLYDVGYSIDTKLTAAKFVGLHDHVKYEFACQTSANKLQTMEEAVAVGIAIRARVSMTPESEFHGTGACRADIFAQSGYLTDTTIKNVIPATFWMALKRSMLHNTTYVQGDPLGDGKHEVTIYRKFNFVPNTPDQKQTLWDNALNYFEVKKMIELFYADLRSIYKQDSSLLSSTMFTDAITYSKYITDDVWAKFAGVRTPLENLFSTIQKEVERLCYRTFDNQYKFKVSVSRNADEFNGVNTYRIRTEIYGPDPARCGINDLIVRPESAYGS